MKTQTYIRILAFSLLGFAACSPLALGQSSPPNVPSPPYVSPLTGDFTMAKKFVYKKKTQDQALNPNLTAEQKAVQKLLSAYKDPKEVDMIEIGTVRRDTELFVDGTSRELWRSGQWQFTPNPIRPDLYVITTIKAGNSIYISGDFAELQWINGGAFKGEQNYQGTKCFLFRSADDMALVDESTGWPVYFESNAKQVSYTYGTPPAVDLQLPPELVKKLDELKKAWSGQ
ncbi:MAG: hypothetical protein WCD79_12360 [Chthoniobacteraceae bacterium]